MLTHKERLMKLYDVLVSHCDEHNEPGTERNDALKRCVNLWNEVNSARNFSEKQAELYLMSTIYDGLAYGNWLWNREEHDH
jgi:hypothetical protein